MNQATQEFITKNVDADVRQLALNGSADVDMPFALDQISGRQTARQKLPSWSAVDGLLYPPRISMEQCSSELTARYKAQILGDGSRIVDLTGGFGVDISFIAPQFSESVYVERQAMLCDIACHNFKLLGLNTCVVCADGIDYLHQMKETDVIYIDPARRDTVGKRTYAIEDCTPNILEIRDEMLDKADRVMIKLSPMLDWRKAVSDIGEEWVSEVHIVAVNNECKELLVIIDKRKAEYGRCQLTTINILADGTSQQFTITQHLSPNTQHPTPIPQHPSPITQHPTPNTFLYEPNAAIMKAGCYAELAETFGVTAIAANSHLFVAKELIDDFPGRKFVVDDITSLNKHEIKTRLKGLTHANITVRNFPVNAVQLRKRLKLKEGGSTYLFATTLYDGQHVLIVTHKA